MNYRNATEILPEHLVKVLQEYVQGDYLYIPVKEGKRREWGELTGCRAAIMERNKEIIQHYKNGVVIEELSKIYFLSTHAIKKILYQK